MLEETLDPGGHGEERHLNPYRWVLPAASACAGLIAAIIGVVAVYLISQGADLQSLLALGYPGISVIMFFSSATVFLPAPGVVAMVGAGGIGQFNPWVLGMFAGFGSSIGELTGYLVGLGGRNALHIEEHRYRWVRRSEYFMRRWGFLTILIMASFPNPFFDAIGILAGSLGYPAKRMWVACMIGNTFKYTMLALLGGTAAGFLFHE